MLLVQYVWNERNGEHLQKIPESYVNIADVRQRLIVKMGQWKISKRVLERIGYVMKRKTVLFRQQVLRNFGINYSEVEWLKNDSKS